MTIAEASARRAESRSRLAGNGWVFIETKCAEHWSCFARHSETKVIHEETSEHSAEHALEKALRYASMAQARAEATKEKSK